MIIHAFVLIRLVHIPKSKSMNGKYKWLHMYTYIQIYTRICVCAYL